MPKNQNNNDEIVIKAKDLDLEQLSFTKLEPNEKCYGQLTAVPKYTDSESPLILQTHKIPMDFYGIPKIDKFHEDDSKRDYCQVPLNPANKECGKLLEILKGMDDWANTPEFRKSVGLTEDYSYSGMIKIPDVKPGDKTATGKPKIDIPSIKFRLSVDYETKQVDTTFMREELVDGEKTIVNIKNTQTIDDVSKNALSFKSKATFIVQLIKLWAKPPAKSEKQKKAILLDYGFTWRIVKAKVESPVKGNSTLKEIKNSNKFLDSEEEEEEKVEEKSVKVVTKINTKPTKEIVQIDSDDDSEDEDDDSKKKEVSKPVAKPIAKSSKAKESDDDSDEEDDEDDDSKKKEASKPKAKIVAKKSKDSDEDEDEEDEDDDSKKKEVPKPKSKIVAKTPAKKGGKTANP